MTLPSLSHIRFAYDCHTEIEIIKQEDAEGRAAVFATIYYKGELDAELVETLYNLRTSGIDRTAFSRAIADHVNMNAFDKQDSYGKLDTIVLAFL